MNNSPHAASTQPAPQTRWPGEPKSVWTVSCAARPQPRSEAGMVNPSGSVVFQLGAFEVPLPRPVEGGVVPASAVHDGAQRVVQVVELGLVLAGLFAPLPPGPTPFGDVVEVAGPVGHAHPGPVDRVRVDDCAGASEPAVDDGAVFGFGEADELLGDDVHRVAFLASAGADVETGSGHRVGIDEGVRGPNRAGLHD